MQAIEKLHRYLGDGFTVALRLPRRPRGDLGEVATLIADRLVGLFRREGDHPRPAMRGQPLFRDDPHWRDLLLFYEYFHGDTGQGLGASHQTGWTGLLANLVMRRYRKDIPEFWLRQRPMQVPAPDHRWQAAPVMA